MPSRAALLVTSCLALLPAAPLRAQDALSPAPARTQLAAPVTIPMSLAGHEKPVVEARVNGKGPFRFFLDTCAGGMVVDASLARELDLPETGRTRIGDPTDSRRIDAAAVRIDSLTLAGAEFHDLPAVAWDRSKLYSAADAPRGVIGFPVFRDCLLTLDYPASTVTIAPGALPACDGREIVPITIERDIPSIALTVAGHTMSAHVDSGSMGGLNIPERLAEGLKFKSPPEVVGRARTVSSEFDVKRAVLEGAVTLAAHSFENPEVSLNGALPSPVVGTQFLSPFRVTFDQANARARFERTGAANAAPAAPRRTIGAMMRPAPEGMLVDKVIPGGAAEKAGLRAGDLITRVNGRPISDFSPADLRAAFTGEAPAKLEVKRAGETLTIEVRPAPAP